MPPDPPSELDRLVLGPDAAYAKAEPRPRPPRRRKGDLETATVKELKTMPPALATSGIAVSALILARDIDEARANGTSARDKTPLHGQYRQHMITLREASPGERKGDTTDGTRERIEKNRQLHIVGE
jgi:hypothetical protein